MELGTSLSLIVFDFDGTLFRLAVDWRALKERLGISSDGSKSFGELLQEYTETNHPNLEVVTEAELEVIGDSRLDDTIARTLKSLVDKGFKLAILTRNSRKAVTLALQGSEVADDIYIVGREDVTMMKPHPEGLQAILSHYECSPEHAVLVGDTFHDVEAAHAAGLQAIVVHNPKLQYPPKGADTYITSIADLLQL